MSKTYFYSREPHALAEGHAFRNPRFFTGAEPDAKKVFVNGDFPDVVAAYEAAGVKVEVVGEATKAPAKPVAASAPGATAEKIAKVGEA